MTFRAHSVRAAISAVAIVAATVAAYLPTLKAGFIWDDESYVTNNPLLPASNGLARIWLEPKASPQYYPLVHSTFWIEYRLWGLNATGYHAVNILLHATGAVLLWQVLRTLAVPGAWLAAMIFALHPVNVESVAWITERKNVLSGVFYFAAALAYLRWAGIGGESPTALLRRTVASPLYVASLLLFVCALFSKTITCSLPAALVLILWWKRNRVARKDLVALLPMFAVGAILGLTTVWLEKHHVGARGIDWVLGPMERCLIAGRAVWFYAGKLAWPNPLMFNYPRWTIDARDASQYLWPVAAVAVASALWLLRSRIGRGPLVAVLIFAGTLAPALGFFDVYPMKFSFVADHFQYHASAAMIALLVAAACALVEWLRRHQTPERKRGVDAIPPVACAPGSDRLPEQIGGAAVLVLLGILTWRQTHIYKDLETLWTDTIHKNPTSWMSCHWLGDLARDNGRKDEAIRWYAEEVRIKPDSINARHALANALAESGRLNEAIDQYAVVVALKPRDPSTYLNLASHLLQANRLDEAIERLRAGLSVQERHADLHSLLGVALSQQGQGEEALKHYRRSLAISPDRADTLNNCGNTLLALGRAEDALQSFLKAASLQPDLLPARTGLAGAYAELGRFDQAVAAARTALDLAARQGNAGVARQMEERIRQYERGSAIP